ncbi:MAG: hypothetical protein ACRDD1_16885, partial [Planctomycetia bacterium]
EPIYETTGDAIGALAFYGHHHLFVAKNSALFEVCTPGRLEGKAADYLQDLDPAAVSAPTAALDPSGRPRAL